jgi:hypothetical protein
LASPPWRETTPASAVIAGSDRRQSMIFIRRVTHRRPFPSGLEQHITLADLHCRRYNTSIMPLQIHDPLARPSPQTAPLHHLAQHTLHLRPEDQEQRVLHQQHPRVSLKHWPRSLDHRHLTRRCQHHRADRCLCSKGTATPPALTSGRSPAQDEGSSRAQDPGCRHRGNTTGRTITTPYVVEPSPSQGAAVPRRRKPVRC